MKTILTTAAALLVLSGSAALAEGGDPAKGEKDFKKCKACHSIISPDGEAIVKGGKTGPNLWGVVGRVAASEPEFGKYGDSITALGETGFVWTPELIAVYAQDPKAFLQDQLSDDGAKSMMTFKLKKTEDVVAFLAQFGAVEPAPGGDDHPEGEHPGGEGGEPGGEAGSDGE